MLSFWYACALIIVPLFAIFYNAILPTDSLRYCSLLWSGQLLIFYGVFWIDIQSAAQGYFFNEFLFLWAPKPVEAYKYFDHVNYTFGWDIYTIIFIGLVNIIFFLCFYYSAFSVAFYIRAHYAILWTIYLLLILTFSALDLFLFYILFEMLLFPMFILIGVWGSRTRKARAATYFYMYTAVFSFFFLFVLVFIGHWWGVYDYVTLKYVFFPAMVVSHPPSAHLVWICFFITFAAKLPITPLHIWLPEAHVEASTVGSVLLASVFLKLGGYGLLRFVLPFFPHLNVYYSTAVAAVCITSVLYATLVAMVQVDLKKVIAYSSIAHMNFAVLGLFTSTLTGFSGGMYLFIGHGFTSAALFFLSGSLYTRFNTRLLKYYAGLGPYLPNLSFYFLFFSFANIGFPGTVNFVAEVLIYQGLINDGNYTVTFILGFSYVCSIMYSVWIYNRIFHGVPNTHYLPDSLSDAYRHEKGIYLTLIFLTLACGIAPSAILACFWLPWASPIIL
jgi:proton-translocating NADH-quinone oxidoreductase chain M